MLSRKLAVLAALSLVFTATPSYAQSSNERRPTSGTTIGDQGVFRSDLLLMLGAVVGAALITLLATQIGGGDDNPVSA